MSNNTEHKVIANSNEWINWIEESIAKGYTKYYDYKHFNNIQEIGFGCFGKVYRANSHDFLALKSFINFNIAAKEIVNELKLQRDVDFHENIIRFYGISTENQTMEILQGLRENPIPNTPEGYVKIYTECWNNDPDKRPTANQIIIKLNEIISDFQQNNFGDIQLSIR
ncbi:unnamed protein product [Rhizophagus irregularis]|nr:unnamed protein product [Rhizophagus irregularis]